MIEMVQLSVASIWRLRDNLVTGLGETPRILYVIFIMWLRSVIKMLPSVKFAEDKVLTFLILREKC